MGGTIFECKSGPSFSCNLCAHSACERPAAFGDALSGLRGSRNVRTVPRITVVQS
jgi:hypothetical protein